MWRAHGPLTSLKTLESRVKTKKIAICSTPIGTLNSITESAANRSPRWTNLVRTNFSLTNRRGIYSAALPELIHYPKCRSGLASSWSYLIQVCRLIKLNYLESCFCLKSKLSMCYSSLQDASISEQAGKRSSDDAPFKYHSHWIPSSRLTPFELMLLNLSKIFESAICFPVFRKRTRLPWRIRSLFAPNLFSLCSDLFPLRLLLRRAGRDLLPIKITTLNAEPPDRSWSSNRGC